MSINGCLKENPLPRQKMMPFVYNADEDGKRVQGEERYEPREHQRQMADYYKQYEEQRAANSLVYGSSGTNQLADIQARLAETQQQIQRLNNEEKEQMGVLQHQQYHQPPTAVYPDFALPPPSFTAPNATNSSTVNAARSSERRRSRSPSWARRSRSRSRSRGRESSGRRRGSSRDRRKEEDRSSRRRRDRSHERSSRSPPSNQKNASSSATSSSRYSRRRRSRSSSRDRDRNSSFRRNQTDRYSDWNPGIPTNKLAILNMPADVDNTKITFALGKCGYLPQDVRTMTKFDRLTKQPRTFAFVEFSDQSTAERWMADFQGWLTLDDGRTLAVEYAKGDSVNNMGNKGDDWICAHCSMNNFVKRSTCFKCEISKDQSMELERLGAHMVGMTPCDTLLIRGLPDGITNSAIFDGLSTLVCLSSISMIKLSESKRFAYLQMKSADEALMLLNLTYKAPIRIKNKDVQVSWCRDSMTRLIQQQMTMLTAGPVREQAPQGNLTGAEIAAAAISKANAVRQASHHVGQLMAHPNQQATSAPTAATIIPSNFSVPPPNLNAPPPVIQPEHQNGVIGVVQTPKGTLPRYLPPNPLTFVHDPNVGYYVDPITKFCYDSTTGYYFNNESACWSTWDLTFQTYFPVETAAKTEEATEEKGKKTEEEGPKSAADLAKDMAKWAKKQEKDKKKVQISLKTKETKGVVELKNVFQQEKHRKLGPSALSADEDDEEEAAAEESYRPSTSSLNATSSAHSNSSPMAPRKPNLLELRESMERALYDEAKKTCMLCKRAFGDVEVLRKHVEKSELHRTNLEAKRAEWGRETALRLREEEEKEPELPKIVYRDRAKERRRQFGIDSTGYAFDVMGGTTSGAGSARNEETMRKESEEASKRPLDDSNIGNRLLKSMGWKEGQGVGKHAQGIVNPIQAERFVQGAGLGAAGSKMRHGVEASHKEKTRQALYSRYHDA
ncbi:unnamed protein product [Caenorhabditis sp. 36 PRJEB53466]|nr:unnamed protein product [Caenorhabditis sp. 36 PRJEB53466]